MSSSNTYPRIAILGAGPVGLTLGSLLAKSNVPYTVYDLRPAPNALSSALTSDSPPVYSGSLDLHMESGLLALKACGLYDQFCALKQECSESMIIADKHGLVRWQDDGGSGERPEIARNTLTDLLLSSIPDQSIKWEHKILYVTQDTTSSAYTIHFLNSSSKDEQQERFDLVFGADGSWSRLRPLLTDIKPHYSTVSCITLTIPSISTAYPQLSALLGGGSYSASGDHKAIMTQRGSYDSVRVYLMLRDPSENYLSELGLCDVSSAELQARLLGEEALFANWGENLKSLIAAACSSSQEPIPAKPLYMLPVSHTWVHRYGLTLLGDAAHVFTPFAGEGVNAGMLDALELANNLIPALQAHSGLQADVDTAIQQYERVMFARIKPIAEETWHNLEMIFSDSAPDGFVAFMESHGPPPASEGEA
jgi:2-polyprenyl-6-methoxyphenol hydroxylase-like FAD-dependent oxidoreductase